MQFGLRRRLPARRLVGVTNIPPLDLGAAAKRGAAAAPEFPPAWWRLAALLAAILLVLAATGAWIYRWQAQSAEREVQAKLLGIAQLQARQLSAWRDERTSDAAAAGSNPFLAEAVDRFLADPRGPEAASLRAFLEGLARHQKWADALVTDSDGLARMSLGGQAEGCAVSARLHSREQASGRPAILDLHADGYRQTPHLAWIVPLQKAGTNTPPSACSLVLVADAEQFLFPFLRAWPTPSTTAESRLLRLDDGGPEYLDSGRREGVEGRHRGAAGGARDELAGLVSRGVTGTVRTRDSRGIDVLAAIVPLPDVPWILIAKVDAAEALDDWQVRAMVILAAVVGLAGLVVSGGVVAWRRLGRAHHRALTTSEAARRAAEGSERRVAAERERLMAAIEQSGETVVITDATGTIQYVNPAFVAVTGYSREEAVGSNPRILKSGEHDAAFYGDLWTAISSGRVWQGRMVNQRKDGSRYTEDATISPVFDADGRIANYVAVKRDVTAQLRMQARDMQAQRMESVGRLAGGVAHDYNNMIAVIVGNAELAIAKLAPGHPVRGDLEEILAAATRSAALTQQLLAFARKQPIAPKVLNLNESVEGLRTMLSRLLGEDILLVWQPAADLWAVRMDPSQLDQIVTNLCVNARDAIDTTGRITIETANARLNGSHAGRARSVDPGEFVLLSISDTGAGMDRETMNRVFEPFFTTKQEGRGTGLGLATVYGIVEQYGGWIDVDSEVGQGTTFTIYFPRHADGSTGASAHEPTRAS